MSYLKNIGSTLVKENWTSFGLFMLVSFATWKMSDSFFWRDEWRFLDEFRNVDFAMFFLSHGGHVKPFFKLIYFIELLIYGNNAILYHYSNLFFHGILIFLFYKTLLQFNLTKTYSIIAACLFGVHPVFFNNLLWSFQICQTLHMLFSLASILFLLKYSSSYKINDLLVSATFMILQNYSFGNGLFYPLLYIFFAILIYLNKSKKQFNLFYMGLVMFLAFIVVQTALSSQKVGVKNILTGFFDILISFIHFTKINVTRYIFIKDEFIQNYIQYLALLFILLFLVYTFFNYFKEYKNEILLITLFFALSSISIPIARPNIMNDKIPFYYSVMPFVPFALLISIALGRLYIKLKFVALILFLSYFAIDQRMVVLFSERHTKNKIALLKSFQENNTYTPFDDPAIKMVKEYKEIKFKEVFDYWKH